MHFRTAASLLGTVQLILIRLFARIARPCYRMAFPAWGLASLLLNALGSLAQFRLVFATIPGLLLVSLSILCVRGEDQFTLAVIPDSQQQVLRPDDDRLQKSLEWLVANRQSLNLKMVLHVGDLLNWDTPDHAQYERASAAMTVLDRATLPYAMALGNHDTAATKVGGSAAPGNVNANLRNTATCNHYFPLARFKALGGVYQTGKIDNAYHTFTAGGLDWLVLNLELWARAGAVDWAKTVLEQHPNHNVIVLTHSYLNARNGIEQTKGGYGDNSPQYVFDHLLKEQANVRLVFSGHVGSHGYRKDVGAHGNTFYQFLQSYHDNLANPIRLFEINTKQGTIKTRVYCPSTGKDKNDGSTLRLTDVDWVPAGSQTRLMPAPEVEPNFTERITLTVHDAVALPLTRPDAKTP
jgi:hypothetical protein